jgi:hypothetical protein
MAQAAAKGDIDSVKQFIKLKKELVRICWARLLSNYNIKYTCTIYTRLYTCLTSIPRFALREKVTLRLLKLLLKGVDVVEWSRALDVRLSEWCCSVSMVWVQIPSREEQKFDDRSLTHMYTHNRSLTHICTHMTVH